MILKTPQFVLPFFCLTLHLCCIFDKEQICFSEYKKVGYLMNNIFKYLEYSV